MADWTDYLKKAVVYTNPLTAGTAIGNAVYKDATGGGGLGDLVGDITGVAKSPGYDTAAAGAKEAQAYLQQLSQTAWDRQMQGLQGALGSFQGYDALAAQMNPRHGGAPAGGGMPGGQANPSLPPPGPGPSKGPALTSRSGAGPYGFGNSGLPSDAPPALPPPGTPHTGYQAPIGATRTPLNPNPSLPPPGSNAPPMLAPPGSAPSLSPPGYDPNAPPALPPPGSPIGAPPSLAPPGIMAQLAAMATARSGRGSF